MRQNLPITQREYDYPASDLLVSTTDTQGRITHCNPAFVKTSGFVYAELIGQPHNLIRHPDMPPEAFKDMWQTIGRGLPWTGLVKNRRKDGDHYWVQANVTPIMEAGKPRGYLSVRIKPSRAQVQEAERLYARMNQERDSGRPSFALVGGQVRPTGLRGQVGALARMPLGLKLALGLAGTASLAAVPPVLGMQGPPGLLAQLGLLAGGSALLLAWFQHHFAQGLAQAQTLARDLAGCNLVGQVSLAHAEPMQSLMRALLQIQINLRAVVGDVRQETGSFVISTQEIAQGSQDLSARTESQASSLEETAASMEQLSGTVKNTADSATEVARESEQSLQVALRGGQAVEQVGAAMASIEASSRKVSDIIAVIEGIAFQTNILALNAAVEAARAGEQGRGFAVVAAEVGALAQRSAGAAKEIRQLINASVQQVSDGSEQMNHAASTIRELIGAVERMGTMVQRITQATHEQATGIAQVNQAMALLDSATQQNAALVEESAAAAAALTQSSETVARSVQVFRMP